MRRTLVRRAAQSLHNDRRPIIHIANGTFYRQHPHVSPRPEQRQHSDGESHHVAGSNPPLFPELNFTLPAFSSPAEKWGVLSMSSAVRTAFLQILKGQHICLPPTARSYPYLSSDEIAAKDQRLRSAHNAVQYVGFDAERGQSGGSGMRGAYLSARYESLREETDFSLLDFLMGNTELNPDERLARHPDQSFLERVMQSLRLMELAEMPVTHLSNGQTRRAKIAKALLSKPEVLLLDGPFMGLDPPTRKHLSTILGDLAEAQAPRLVLSLKPDEHVPEWITHMAFLTQNFRMDKAGGRQDVVKHIHRKWEELRMIKTTQSSKSINDEFVEYAEVSRHLWAHSPSRARFEDRRAELASIREGVETRQLLEEGVIRDKMQAGQEIISRDGFRMDTKTAAVGEAIIEMEGVKVQYGDKAVLGNWKQVVDSEEKEGLWWDVRRGQRWGVFGPNGSGKTTLISLITSDHPQTYSLPIKLFGRTRLPRPGQPGISIFDLQRRMGHSSPEVHVFFPKHLSLRKTIESAWADTPLTKPKLTYDIDEKVSAALMWFRGELVPSLGPPKWMMAEMDRDISGVDKGYFDVKREPLDTSLVAYHMNIARTAILNEQQEMEGEDWADNIKFGDLSFSSQRVALFIRAVIRNPDLVVLDEAFSGMDDFARDKCQLFLSHGENAMYHFKRLGTQINSPKIRRSDLSKLGMVKVQGLQDSQALVVISHKKEEVPGCVRNWICLPENGRGLPRFGQLSAPLELASSGWEDIWGDEVGGADNRWERKRWLEILRSHPDWPRETPEQRKARLERFNQHLENLRSANILPQLMVPSDDSMPRAIRSRHVDVEDKDLRLEVRRKRDQAELQAQSPEERERRLAQDRVRWEVKMNSMTLEERKQFHRDRNARFLEDRPDRVARVQEISRQAARRFRAKMTDEERLARNAKVREVWKSKRATMSPEELSQANSKRRERHRKRMEDPTYAARHRAAALEGMKRYRAAKMEKQALASKEVND